MKIGDTIIAKIIDHTSMGVAIEFHKYKGLLMWKTNFIYKKHTLVSGNLIQCKIVRINNKSFDATLLAIL